MKSERPAFESLPQSGELSASDGARPVVAITGGSSGIGLATAIRFSAAGYHVAICARHPDRLVTAVDRIRDAGPGDHVTAISADLTRPTECGHFVAQVMRDWQRLDVFVNNAGVAPLANLTDISDEAFEELINVNIRSLFYLTRQVWRIMQQQSFGTLINISSLAAIDPFPGFSIYGASKAWLDVFTHALADEGRAQGIRAFALRCGAVETPLLRNLFPDFAADQALAPGQVAEVIWSMVQPGMQPASGAALSVKA